ncbi:MAG: sigma factor [Pirellulaceae bacterium]
MSTSDLVQETMLAAHRDFGDFRGGSEELLAWLRQILSNCLSHAVQKNIHAKKRTCAAKLPSISSQRTSTTASLPCATS